MQKIFLTLILAVIITSFGCDGNPLKKPEPRVIPLGEVPSQRLNYRFEADVPAAGDEGKIAGQSLERNEAVQKDFDENRPLEILDRTVTSPGKQRVAAVYRKPDDLVSEFRMDLYSADGKLIRKVTHEELAIHFPDTILWSPDSSSVAFVAMVRGRTKDIEGVEAVKKPDATPSPTPTPVAEVVETAEDTNSNVSSNENSDPEPETSFTPEPPNEVITFRTEQIYLADATTGDVKPLTQNEGLMYFYFAWSPDGSALGALATTITEWKIQEARAKNAKQVHIPQGRPRIVEKNGRERLLDDYATTVHPAWSPDSAKIAVAFNKQIRIYDATGERPTQAAIPLNNDLLLASKTFEEKQKEEGNEVLEDSNSNTESNSEPGKDLENVNTNVEQSKTTLPDAKSLVSFNPIINLEWNQEAFLYLQTGSVWKFIDEIENTSSYLRWHRLVLSPQAIKVQTKSAE